MKSHINRPDRETVKSRHIFTFGYLESTAVIGIVFSVIICFTSFTLNMPVILYAGGCILFLCCVFLYRRFQYDNVLSSGAAFKEYEKTIDAQGQKLLQQFSDEKLIRVAFYESRKNGPSEKRIELINRELAQRDLLASDKENSLFTHRCDFPHDNSTVYLSDKCIAVEDWLKEDFSILRLDAILEFSICSYPSIGKRGVLFCYKYPGKQLTLEKAHLSYAPYAEIDSMMKAVAEHGFSVQDERKPNDRSRTLFKNIGVKVPSKKDTKITDSDTD